MDLDFFISLGMGWSRILSYLCVITLHDSYLYIDSYPYVKFYILPNGSTI